MYIRDKAGICELKDRLTETSQVKCKEEENEEKARIQHPQSTGKFQRYSHV